MKTLSLVALALLVLPGVLSARTDPPPPQDLVTVPAGPEVETFWPYTGRDYSTAPTDPINLIFVGSADPRVIRQALLSVDGDRTSFGFPDAFPFNCTWSDAIGSPQTGYSDDAGWQGSALQLQCGEYASLRLHVRLFRQGSYTLGGAHMDVLIPGTTSHEAISWVLPREVITVDLARSGVLAAAPESTPLITPAPKYRTIRAPIFNGLPVGLRAALGLPQGDQSSDVPIPNDGVATVLALGGEVDREASDVVVEFDHPFDQTIPKPFCQAAPWELLKVEGNVHMVHRVRTRRSGKYTARFMASGILEVTPVDGRTGVPSGPTHQAVVSEVHRSGLTDRRQAASMKAIQVLLAEPTESLFEKLCDYTGFEMALPMNTGAEAVETALKMARLWGTKVKGIPDGEQEIICFEENFHGRTITIVSFSTDPDANTGFGPYTPGFKVIPYNDARALEDAITDKTVAVLIEPIQGEAGVNVPDEGYLGCVRRICTDKNVLMIADEVQTGFCRTGRRFAVDHENVRPDAMCLGKALGGGVFPVSAVVADKAVLGVFTPGSHGSTFGGNPLGAAVAIASIEVLENERLDEKAEDLGQYLRGQLEELVGQVPRLQKVRGKGLLNAVVFDDDFQAWDVCVALKEHGLLAKQTHGNIIRFAPPLVITREELDHALAIIREVFLAIK